MATFEKAVKCWTETINGWYGLEATPEDVEAAFHQFFDGKTFVDETDNAVSYVNVFFKDPDGSWSESLDTMDREELADAVEVMRGNGPLPTYADLGGSLLNKAPRPAKKECCGKCSN